MEIEEYDEKTIERIKTFERMFGEPPTEEDIEILKA
jgi:hypothetical protein